MHISRCTSYGKEKSMRTKVRLRIDHRKAIVAAVTDEEEEIELIISKVEKQLRQAKKEREQIPIRE